jgi:hypothetical protein
MSPVSPEHTVGDRGSGKGDSEGMLTLCKRSALFGAMGRGGDGDGGARGAQVGVIEYNALLRGSVKGEGGTTLKRASDLRVATLDCILFQTGITAAHAAYPETERWWTSDDGCGNHIETREDQPGQGHAGPISSPNRSL